ncbi:MAG: ATP-binding protein [Prevotella sp.]|nr:ATP-binding protein [Prevotella sp.]
MNENFSITPRIIAHFGEFLIKDEKIALVELVKNAYDANARHCWVDFHDQDGKVVQLIIKDDGRGMSENIVRNAWLVIGTDYKQREIDKVGKGERVPLGEKGVGRLGVHKLGRLITLITKAKESPEIELTINWDDLAGAATLDDFGIPVTIRETPSFFKGVETGTIIKIDKLKSGWDRRQLREVYRNLMSLNNPFAETNEDFVVKVESNNPYIFQGMQSFEDIISNGGMYYGSCTMEGTSIVEFQYDYKPWRTLTKVTSGRHIGLSDLDSVDLTLTGRKVVNEEGREKEIDYQINLGENGLKIGKIKFDIIIFETDTQLFNYINTEKKTIKDYLKENGGIRVYRDNVRVYNYGERDNDWLGIDLKRVHRLGGNVSNNIILGAVRLDRLSSKGLEEKTNREGFIENESYLGFVDAINYVLSLIVRMRNEDKERLTMLYRENKAVEPVLSDLDDAIQYVEKKVSDPKDKKYLTKCLKRVNEQYKTVKSTLIKSANAGLNLSIVIHEIDKQISALTGAAKRGEQERVANIAANLEKIVRGYTLMIRKSSVLEGDLYEVIRLAVNNYEFRFSDHKIKVIVEYDDAHLRARFAKSEAVAVLTNLLDNAIYWVSKTREKDNRIISIYLTQQIAGYSTIVVSDNGPGFNIGTDVAVQPFITGKPNNIGMGLGLHIASEMMHAIKGNLVFYEDTELLLPDNIRNNGAVKAIVALCFPMV